MRTLQSTPKIYRSKVVLVVLLWIVALSGLTVGQQAPEKDKPAIQVGQLLVAPLAAGDVPANPAWGLTKPPKRGHHFVVVSIKVKNNSSYPNCTHFLASLLTDAGRKYSAAIWRAPDPPEIERLPWQGESIGGYTFQVRDGEKPRALVLERNFIIERECWGLKGFSPDAPFSTNVHIPLEGLPSPSLQPEKAVRPSGPPKN